MRMNGLARLHASMRHVGIERVRFRIQHNHLTFDGVFLADVTPYELALGCVGHQFVLIYHIDRHYNVDSYIHDPKALAALKAALGTGASSGRPFSARTFLEEIDAKLPHQVSANDRPDAAYIVRVYRDVDEADKVHFVRWAPHAPAGKHVTAANLAKTRKLLGQAAHDWCARNNVSSAWTDIAPAQPASTALLQGRP